MTMQNILKIAGTLMLVVTTGINPVWADSASVLWTPATKYVDGSQLPANLSWTRVEQYKYPCMALVKLQPQPVPNQTLTQKLQPAVFNQPQGTCWCYVASTVLGDTPESASNPSTPVRAQKCASAGGGGG